MARPFLDTSVFVCAFHSNEPYHKKAKDVIKLDYLTSPLVHKEIELIHDRRREIYKSVVRLMAQLETTSATPLLVTDLYKRCFKANYGNNRNDTKHLDTVFGFLLKLLDINESTRLDLPLLTDFLKKTQEIFDEAINKAKFLLVHLNNPEVRQRRVVLPNIGGKFNKLHAPFKSIRNYKFRKSDVDILIHGIEYSCYTKTYVDIITNDKEMSDLKETAESIASKIFNPLFFEIYHLPSYGA